MPARRGSNDAAGGEVGVAPPVASERITVALIQKAGDDLKLLQERTQLSKTDLVNRAITLYEFIDAQQRNGRDLLVRDKATGETQALLIL